MRAVGRHRAGHRSRSDPAGLRDPSRTCRYPRPRSRHPGPELHAWPESPAGLGATPMNAVIFAGPSLPPSRRPPDPRLIWKPPVKQGDLYRAALGQPAIIGVVDGYFETVPTVWHKEILWAMAQGIHVYGSASIGALRAAELSPFGMKGVGKIYEAFRDG